MLQPYTLKKQLEHSLKSLVQVRLVGLVSTHKHAHKPACMRPCAHTRTRTHAGLDLVVLVCCVVTHFASGRQEEKVPEVHGYIAMYLRYMVT